MNKLIEKKAIKFCEENKHRLSLPRLEVLKIIGASKRPIKAYDILNKLGEIIPNPKPPTAYRAIEFWLKHNFIHKIESLNAYAVCNENHLHHGSHFLICDGCGVVIESHLCSLPVTLKESVEKISFIPKKWNFEISGTCKKCI
ncbi:MAG: Fur family transcriptional regulator [Pseudomonadota bacterium]|nr:Fur family transcriptional regulator [Pseudomonadota bacterium]